MILYEEQQSKNDRVLIVDDNPSIHEDFRKVLGQRSNDEESLDDVEAELFGERHETFRSISFEIDSAFQGEEGIDKVRTAKTEGRPYALAYVDVRMPPGLDGIETTQKIWQIDPQIQIVICTAFSDYTISEILELFGPTDQLLILKKPYDLAEVTLMTVAMVEKWNLAREWKTLVAYKSECLDDANRVLTIIQSCQEELQSAHNELKDEADVLCDRLQKRTAEILGTRDVAVMALAQLAESRDPETGEHLDRMRAYSQILAEYLYENGPYTHLINERFLEDFYRSTPLHDIGKVGIPDEILLKPGKLTPAEFEIMKTHTLLGAQALQATVKKSNYGGFLNMAIEIARSHHEKFNGTGYPDRLCNLRIPLSARIVAVADVFDALTSKRVYKDAMDPAKARKIIEEEEGEHFDPVVVAAFRACFDDFLAAKTNIESPSDIGGASTNVLGLAYARQFANSAVTKA